MLYIRWQGAILFTRVAGRLRRAGWLANLRPSGDREQTRDPN